MDNTINGRTPEEIKLGLKTCAKGVGHCKECPYGFNGNGACAKSLHSLDLDALAYIQLLEDGIDRVYKHVNALHGLPEKIQQLQRERDAAVKYGLVRTEAKIAIPAVITNPYYCHKCDMQFAVLNDKPEAVMHCPFCGARRGEPPKTEP